jgi:hypothetical protein
MSLRHLFRPFMSASTVARTPVASLVCASSLLAGTLISQAGPVAAQDLPDLTISGSSDSQTTGFGYYQFNVSNLPAIRRVFDPELKKWVPEHTGCPLQTSLSASSCRVDRHFVRIATIAASAVRVRPMWSPAPVALSSVTMRQTWKSTRTFQWRRLGRRGRSQPRSTRTTRLPSETRPTTCSRPRHLSPHRSGNRILRQLVGFEANELPNLRGGGALIVPADARWPSPGGGRQAIDKN